MDVMHQSRICTIRRGCYGGGDGGYGDYMGIGAVTRVDESYISQITSSCSFCCELDIEPFIKCNHVDRVHSRSGSWFLRFIVALFPSMCDILPYLVNFSDETQ